MKPEYEKVLKWWSKLERKLKDKPDTIKILRKRSMNSAISVLDNIRGLDFSEISTSLYFTTQDLKMQEFTKLYDAQVELAAIDEEKFVFQLHNFFNMIATKIKKENLYEEFFEFYYKCVKLRYTNQNDNLNSQVIVAYINLLIQTLEYLKPNKYDFKHYFVGKTTKGETMLSEDPFPMLDRPNYELQTAFENKLVNPNNINGYIHDLYKKYGYEVNSLEDIEIISYTDRLHYNSVTSVLPFVNEFTYDILPERPFTTKAYTFELIMSMVDTVDLKKKLLRRNKTLPTNGVLIKFNDNRLFEEVLLKEIFYEDTIFLLYKVKTTEGDTVGFFDTREQYFYSIFLEYTENLNVHKNFGDFILFLYGCYCLNDENYQLNKLHHYFLLGLQPLSAEGYLQGGKLKNRFNPDKEHKDGVARIDNDNYTTETRGIQGYIRKLPEGQKASEKAIELAEALGYSLAYNETYVQPFTKQIFKLKIKS